MQGLGIIFGITLAYVVVTTLLGMQSAKYAKDTAGFLTAKNMMGPFVVGVLVMSEFIGTAATLGTAQTAFIKGISAAWNLVGMGIGFFLYALFIAPKLNRLKEYTISGAVAQKYGSATRMAVSGIMTYALIVVNVSMYTGGAATLSLLLGVSVKTCVFIVGAATILNVAFGGLRGVGISNLIHMSFKYIGLVLVSITAWKLLRATPIGLSNLPAGHFSLTGIGIPTMIAWTIANIGAVFSTQYVIQCIASLNDEKEARKAGFVASVCIVPIGFFAAYIGISARSLFPTIKSVFALPVFLKSMDPWTAGVVTASIMATTLVTISACQLGATALIMKDFFVPWFKPAEKNRLLATRWLSVLIGLAPIPFALYVPGLLKTIFFARALRTTVSVIVVFMFYLPMMGSSRSAFWGLILGSVGVVTWFFLGDPFGIDNIYIGVAIPALVMLGHGLISRGKKEKAAAAGVPQS
jgi:SSS family solute:Na+ symporter